ncbi:MAG TPA: sulfite exporter TauE/SafE family protein [Gemmatimonadota bacterium]
MSVILAAVFVGLLAGVAHVLAGADHLAAVAPLAAGGRGRAWRAGFRWGLGHAAGVTLVGTAAIALERSLPIGALTSWSESAVGVILIGIGIWAGMRARAALRDDREAAVHMHDHVAGHGQGPHGHGHRHLHDGRAALAVGLVHGTAGGSHILGVLPALALPTQAAGIAYLTAFGVGTVAAMTLFASAVGFVGRRASRSGRRVYAGLVGASAVLSIAVGAWWLAAS